MRELLHRILARSLVELPGDAMNSNSWLIVGAAAALAAALTWAATSWWFGRKLLLSRARVNKLEKTRQTLSQQATQARKQHEQMQAELAELRHSLTRLTRYEAAKAQEQRVLAASQGFEDSGPFVEPPDHLDNPADGFADTHFFMPKKL
jgi:TolA-binding protein